MRHLLGANTGHEACGIYAMQTLSTAWFLMRANRQLGTMWYLLLRANTGYYVVFVVACKHWVLCGICCCVQTLGTMWYLLLRANTGYCVVFVVACKHWILCGICCCVQTLGTMWYLYLQDSRIEVNIYSIFHSRQSSVTDVMNMSGVWHTQRPI